MPQRTFWQSVAAIAVALICAPHASSQDKALTFEDMMRFRSIERPVVSRDGRWVAYGLKPDRGDGEAIVRSTESAREFRLARGSGPVLTNDGRWVGARLKPEAEAIEKAGKNADKLKYALAILNTQTGDTVVVKDIDQFQFTEDSRWVLVLLAKEQVKDSAKASKDSAASKTKKDAGSDLLVRRLSTGKTVRIPFVKSMSVDTLSRFLVYAVEDSTGVGNGLFVRDLADELGPERPVLKSDSVRISHLVWNNRTGGLAFVSAELDSKEKPKAGAVWVWEPDATRQVGPIGAGWIVPSVNDLRWSRDGLRLYLGLRPASDTISHRTETDSTVRLFDVASILEKRGVDIWHWNDQLINPHQKKEWKKNSEHVYRAVYSAAEGTLVQLADTVLEQVLPAENPWWALGSTDLPYLKEITWDGAYADYYVVNQRTGERKKFLRRQSGQVLFSDQGQFAAFFRDSSWHLYSVQGDSSWNATQTLGVAFYNEEDDTPGLPGSYGSAGWMSDGSAVLVYDRFDVWALPTDGSAPRNVTKGQGRGTQFRLRIVNLDPRRVGFTSGEVVHVSAFHDREKFQAIYVLDLASSSVRELASGPYRHSLLGKALGADKVLYTRESYNEFPNLWAGDASLRRTRQVSDANPQTKNFAWGNAQLVEWTSLDGIPLQGVLITPSGAKPGERYPVIVYFYELMSHLLYSFNEVVVNHRPCFPFYASNGYAIFLPDVRYQVGRPGLSATKCVVPGVQKLIEMGIADPKAIALHGHSWGGYETAFIVTQTDIFAAAIAGAAVGNMTSAYSGIRWGTGLARQFQYEKAQSRIGGSLWEYPERFIENSPVFFADKIRTPLLLMHGDDDDAVPWYQSIELYLALRRLGKDCIFLEYRNEPHHPRTYPNKLDYAIRMKEYFDHYLKGAAAPAWITDGIPYDGK